MRIKRGNIFIIMLTVCLLFTGIPQYNVMAEPGGQEEETPVIDKVDLGLSDFALAVGHEKEIVLPDYELEGEILEKRVQWTFSSAAKKKLELTEEGKIRAKEKGKVKVKVECGYYKEETLIAQGSKSFYIYGTNPKIDTQDYRFNKHEQSQLTIPLGGCYNISTVKYKSSSKNLAVKRKNTSLYLTPSKAGKYTVDVTIDDVEFHLTFDIINIYFKRDSNTVADASSKKWVRDRSMVCLKKGESTTLLAYGFSKDQKLKWTSSNPKVASVSKDGKVKAKEVGQSVITVTGVVSGQEESITYVIGVANKLARAVIKYGYKHWQSKYSQPKRMQKGYYDCSSFIWRSYMNAGFNIGKVKNNYAPVAAEEARWCVNNHYMIYSGTVDVSKLLPGDIIFWTGAQNGRYKGIYHVDLYLGNNTKLTVPNERYLGGTIRNCMVARISGSKPEGFKAVKTQKDKMKAVKLNWRAMYGADGYNILRRDKKTGKYKSVAKVKTNEFLDMKCKKGKTYSYLVRPYYKGNGKTYYGRNSESITIKY